jgi:hypothetical protein
MNRPTSITVIAWIWIALGVLMFFGGVFHVVMLGVIQASDSLESANAGDAQFLLWLFVPLSVLEFVGSVVAIISGAYLMRLRRWARTCLEIMSWIACFFFAGGGAVSAVLWVLGSGAMREEAAIVPSTLFTVLGAAFSVVFGAAMAVPFAVIIKFLRGRTIGDALRRAGGGADASGTLERLQP